MIKYRTMPRPPRLLFKNAFYHIYNRGVNKAPIVADERDRRTFIHLLGENILKYQLRVFAYCLMDNHFHLFLQTPQGNLDQFMWDFQRNYAHFFNSRHNRIGTFFQNRYKSRLVNDESYALTLTRYIHQNPAEAGMISDLGNYSWSSYPCYAGQLPHWNWLDIDWLLNQLHQTRSHAIEEFIKWHAKPLTDKEKNSIEKSRVILRSKGTRSHN